MRKTLLYLLDSVLGSVRTAPWYLIRNHVRFIRLMRAGSSLSHQSAAGIMATNGPLLLAGDRAPGLTYRGSLIDPAPPELWG